MQMNQAGPEPCTSRNPCCFDLRGASCCIAVLEMIQGAQNVIFAALLLAAIPILFDSHPLFAHTGLSALMIVFLVITIIVGLANFILPIGVFMANPTWVVVYSYIYPVLILYWAIARFFLYNLTYGVSGLIVSLLFETWCWYAIFCYGRFLKGGKYGYAADQGYGGAVIQAPSQGNMALQAQPYGTGQPQPYPPPAYTQNQEKHAVPNATHPAPSAA